MTHAATVVPEVEGLLGRQAAVEIDFEAFEMAVRRSVMWVAARAVEHRLNAVQIVDRFHAKHHEQGPEAAHNRWPYVPDASSVHEAEQSLSEPSKILRRSDACSGDVAKKNRKNI